MTDKDKLKNLVPDLIAPNDYFLCVTENNKFTVIKGHPILWLNKFYSELYACVLKNGEFHRFSMQEKLVLNRFSSNNTLISWDCDELEKIAQILQPYSFIKLNVS